MLSNMGQLASSLELPPNIYSSIYNLIPTPVYLWQSIGDDFKLIHYNDAAFRITEGKVQDRLGVLARTFYQNEPDVFDVFDQCKKTKSTILKEWEYDFKTIKVKKPIRARFSFLEPDFVVAIVEDLSDYMNYKNELEEQRNHLALFIEHSPAALAMLDDQMRYIYCSQRWLSDYKLNGQDIIGKSHYDVFPEIGEEWRAIHQSCLKGKIERRDQDCFMRQDGSLDWMKWAIHPWYKSGGAVGGIIMLTEVITEQKLLEGKIAESECRLKLATQAGKIGIWDLDVLTKKMIWNEQMYHLYGIEDVGAPITYQFWMEHIHPEEKDRLVEQINHAFAVAEDFDMEFRIVQPKGKVLNIRAEGRILKDEQEKPVRLIGLNRDVTEKTEFIMSLQRMNMAVVERVKELNCLYRVSELCRKSTASFQEIMAEALPIIAAAFRYHQSTCVRIIVHGEVYSNGRFELTDWALCADIFMNQKKKGRIEVCYLEEMPAADEGPFLSEERLLLNSLADIIGNFGELKEAALSLKNSEEKYRYLFDNNPALIMIWDLELMQICEVNQKTIDLYGYSREEFIGMSVLAYHPEEDHPKITRFAHEMLEQNFSVQENKWRHLKKTGEELVVEISSHKINYQNRPAVLSLARDITQQTKFEYELKRSEDRYHALVEHAADAILMINDNGLVFSVNHSAAELLQMPKDSILGCTISELELHQDQNLATLIEIGHINSNKYDRKIHRPDGSVVEVEIGLRNIPEGTGTILIARDVTERNHTLEQIKKSESRMISLLENSPVPLAINGSDGSISFINKKFVETFGYTLEEVPNVDIWSHLAYPDAAYREQVMKEWAERSRRYFTEQGPFAVLEAMVCCKNGGYRIIEFNQSVLDEETLIIFHDITERKNMEKVLIQREEKFRALTENITDAIVLSDFDNNILYRSPATQKITGYYDSEVPSLKLQDLVHPDDRDYCDQGLQQVKRNVGGVNTFQLRLMHKEGRIVWIEGTVINLLHNESVGAIVCNFRDITQRRLVEEQLALSSLIIGSTDDAIISRTIGGTITSWNPGAQKLLGYSADEALGLSSFVLVPDHLHQEEEEFNRKINQGITIDHYETLRIRKDGNSVVVSLKHSPIFNEFGQVIGVSTILRDITVQKMLEQEKTKVIQDLIQRNRDLEQFSYIVSHNLRAPVANILGLSDLLLDNYMGQIDTNEVNIKLNKSIHLLDQVINDLNFILQSRKSITEQTTLINLNELLAEIMMSISSLIQKERAKINFDFSPMPNLESIKSYLYSIFYNLITNSIKYRRPDLDPEIRISCFLEGDLIKIIFQDNGLGIDMQKKGDQVFGLYKRFHNHTEGRGMGLYMVKAQVEALGGTISLNSAINKGSRFLIVLQNKNVV